MIQKDHEMKEKYLKSLSDAQCEKIHMAALEILKKTGVIFQSEEACKIFKKGGAKVEGEKVFITEPLIKWALKVAPSSFMFYNQEGKNGFKVGGRSTYFGSGSDCLNILDHRNGRRRDPTVKDLKELVKICDYLDNIDFLMSMVIPADFPRDVADRVQMEVMLNGSTKPIIAVSFNFEGTKDIIKMAEIVAGGEESLQKKPFIVHYIQPVRALFHNEDTVKKLIYTAKKGLPCLYLVSAVMGFTGPITTAGYQAMGVAGQLAALVLSQLIREGTPFIVRGGRVVVTDMKTMLSTFASPEDRIESADMAHWYNLPCFGTAGCSDSKLVDMQAASEASLTLMADVLVGANLIHDVGYIEAGVTYSAEMLVLSNEIISWIKKFKLGIKVNEETLALNLINKLGFKGNFLSTEHTLKHYREQWEPNIFDRNIYESWKEKGSFDIKDKINYRIEKILSEHKCRTLPQNIKNKINEITERARKAAHS